MVRLTLVVLAAALAGCTPADEAAAPTTTSTPEPTIAASVLASGSTPYDTVVKVGEPLMITGRSADDKGLLRMVVTAVEPKPASLLRGYERSDGMVPVFVRVSITNAAPRDMSTWRPRDLNFIQSDGTQALSFNYNPKLPGCEVTEPPAGGLTTKGASYEVCYSLAIPKGQTITRVMWDGPFYGPYDAVGWSA